jgi:uncharacterized membrane protein
MVLATSGPRRVEHDTTEGNGKNVGDAERLLSVLGGTVLTVMGANRRGGAGIVMALMGAELIRRGATGHCMVYEATGISTKEDSVRDEGRGGEEARGGMLSQPAGHDAAREAAHGGSLSDRSDVHGARATVNARKSVKIERRVTVQRSAAELYAFWRDPRNMPQVMQIVDSVEPIDSTHAHWRATGPGGKKFEWVAEIINDLPNELIAWKSDENADVANAGSVHFKQIPGGGTEVRLVMDYEPPFGKAGYVLSRLLRRDPDEMLREDLERFRQMMESGTR